MVGPDSDTRPKEETMKNGSTQHRTIGEKESILRPVSFRDAVLEGYQEPGLWARFKRWLRPRPVKISSELIERMAVEHMDAARARARSSKAIKAMKRINRKRRMRQLAPLVVGSALAGIGLGVLLGKRG
jgi:hypothetical protein